MTGSRPPSALGASLGVAPRWSGARPGGTLQAGAAVRAGAAVLVGAVVACLAGPAAAQAPAPATPSAGGAAAAAQFPECTRTSTEADVEGAKGAHKAATQFFERGDYERALSYWRDAYGFDCSRPPLLLNIASAYEKKGDKAAAIAVLELFLTRAKDSPDAPVVQEKIANLRTALDAERASATPTPAPAGPATPAPEAPAEGATERPYGIAPWIVVGAGAGVALIGVVPLVIGTGKVSDAEEACATRSGCTADVADQGNTGRSLSLVGQIMIPVGLATAAGGLVWQLAFNDEQPVAGGAGLGAKKGAAPSAPGATLVPAVGPGFQGAVVTGAF